MGSLQFMEQITIIGNFEDFVQELVFALIRSFGGPLDMYSKTPFCITYIINDL